jgi:heat-inducible transcriptional repressor
MEGVTHLLSELTHHVGFMIVPDLGRMTFGHIDLVRLPHPRILVILVSSTGIVTHKTIEIDDDEITQDHLQACANYLNAQFAGMSLPRIRQRLLDLMGEEKARYDRLLQRVIAVARRTFEGTGSQAEVFLDGTANILEPSQDLDQMRALFKTFEEKSRLVRILSACLGQDGVRITIGRENADQEMSRMAVVTATCSVGGDERFGLGVLGSTRMEYARMVALVEFAAASVQACIEELRA